MNSANASIIECELERALEADEGPEIALTVEVDPDWEPEP